jgi:hypothetical protein
MNAKSQRKVTPLLLSAALSAALFAATPAFAQDAPPPEDEVVADASVPKDRLVDRYTELAGSPEAAEDVVTDLRTGSDFTVVTTETQPVLNPDGTQATNPDGTPQTEVVTVETVVANPNGPMGWGEVNITLSMAQALVDGGVYPDLQSALTGLETTVTNPDGTVVTTVEGGVLAMRADGMGWGAIAKELGYNLGSLVSASNRGERVDAATAGKANGRSATAGKPDRIARADRPERPVKPDRIDRPQRPDRPERPQKPERGGRP